MQEKYLIFLLLLPLVFYGLDGEWIGGCFSSLVLLSHLMAKQADCEKQKMQQKMDLNYSSQGLINSVMTFTLFLSLRKNKEAAKLWLSSMLLLLLFYVPNVGKNSVFSIETETAALTYALGLFVSGVVKSGIYIR